MKDDKKKVIVLGALVAVMLGVGAFTFLGGSPTPPPAPVVAKKEDKKDPAKGETLKVDEKGNPIAGTAGSEGAEGAEPPTNPLVATALPQRDPFAVRPIGGVDPMAPNQIVHQPQLPKPQSAPRSSGRRSSGGDMSIPPVRPPSMGGDLPLPNGNISLTPTGPDPSAFNYSLTGTLTGSGKNVAVFTDSNGSQRMVPVGGSLDGDSKVVAIEKGSVTIEHRGKKQRISQGGNP